MLASKDQEIQPWAPHLVPLEATSTYNAHFQNWGVHRAQTCKPKNERMQSATAFSGRSTAQDSFMGWDKDYRRQSCKPTAKTQFSDLPMDTSTTHRESFREWRMPKQPSFKPSQQALPATSAFAARSTAQDSFTSHADHRPPKPFLPKDADPLDRKIFDSISTNTASYLPWPVQRNSASIRPVAQLDLGHDSRAPTGTSVHRDAFTEIRLPPGCKAALGVQVTLGDFHLMIPKGTATPCQKGAVFTTTVADQEVMEVVVIALPTDQCNPSVSGKELGRIAFGKITRGRVGSSQVDVTMYLGLDNTIRVSAHNRQTDHCLSLSIRDKVAPTPPRTAPRGDGSRIARHLALTRALPALGSSSTSSSDRAGRACRAMWTEGPCVGAVIRRGSAHVQRTSPAWRSSQSGHLRIESRGRRRLFPHSHSPSPTGRPLPLAGRRVQVFLV